MSDEARIFALTMSKKIEHLLYAQNKNKIILRFTRCTYLNTIIKMLRTELHTLNCVYELANIVSPRLFHHNVGPIFIGDKQ